MVFANYTLNSINLENEIKNIFFEIFPNISSENFDWKKHQKDYENWDSFAQLHLITLTESKFDIEIGLDESISITSAQDLLDCVKSLI